MSEEKMGFWSAMASTFTDRMRAPPKDPEIEAQECLEQALACLDERKPRHSRQAGAAALAQRLRAAPPDLLREMLAALSVGLGADKRRLKEAVDQIDWHDVDMAALEGAIGKSLGSRRRKLCQLWLSMEGAVEFLVWLRGKALIIGRDEGALGPLRADLDELMGVVFAQGMMQMEPITWRAPAVVLEKIMLYEKVHEMRSWGDLKSRLDRDRRLFAMFHSGWPDEPLAFLEVALTRGMARSTAQIFMPEAAVDPAKADTATYYSINSTHEGLRGISFGEDLIRKSVEAMRRELPHVKAYCTLSPIPGFGRWLDGLGQSRFEALCGPDVLDKLGRKAGAGASKTFLADIATEGWELTALGEASRDVLERLCAKYLASVAEGGERLDPVARFHLGNGARVEALRHLGDPSPRGMAQSRGMMVNYIYDLGELDKNKISHGEGGMAASWSVRRLARG